MWLSAASEPCGRGCCARAPPVGVRDPSRSGPIPGQREPLGGHVLLGRSVALQLDQDQGRAQSGQALQAHMMAPHSLPVGALWLAGKSWLPAGTTRGGLRVKACLVLVTKDQEVCGAEHIGHTSYLGLVSATAEPCVCTELHCSAFATYLQVQRHFTITYFHNKCTCSGDCSKNAFWGLGCRDQRIPVGWASNQPVRKNTPVCLLPVRDHLTWHQLSFAFGLFKPQPRV